MLEITAQEMHESVYVLVRVYLFVACLSATIVMELYIQKHNAFVTFDQYKKNNYKKRANSINLYSLRSPFIKHIATSFNDEEKGR